MNVILKGKFVVSCEIEAVTGLHIGTGRNSMEIGGNDNPVIKDAEGKPYIPGSSLKGKMRSLMEFAEEKVKENLLIEGKKGEIYMHMCDDPDCVVCGLFGRNHGDHTFKNGQKRDFTKSVLPTRLLVRDAKLVEDSISEEMKDYLDMEWTEVKWENSLDRITSKANPRQTERIPAGAKFSAEFVVNRLVVDNQDDGTKFIEKLIQAMKLLEDDYLGGHGSRGSGKVRFVNIKLSYRSKEYYEGSKKEEEILQADNLQQLTEKLADFAQKISSKE
ncbi:type III-A CRISPR-associated RAMP protein Csm3 [Pseudothermotoga thermarum]|uniref:CRISPR system Cms endoribonuclease Csm3 n=1 Tax=Pseudothermotoga thermarum DSM 5069 TaxID=688269 RepID=F7YTM9_9THEM|nr:type III-A CRISPR-associated RAMP protein Csm3 [Pseudothermotoga thermarum]AEH51251.1 CRISPR-associated protein, Csm3 family [Pseudothermotoga thermarum DSM 5069]